MISKLDRVAGSLAGLSIGDALGMPYEIMKLEEILAVTNGKGVTGFDSPYPTGRQRKISDMRDAKFGDTTDDTQLALVVAESLIAKKQFDLRDQAHGLGEAEKTSRFGWGKTTQVSARELAEYFDSKGKRGRRWDKLSDNSKTKGTGNGVAMKVAPLALFQAVCGKHFFFTHHEIMQLGYMTHRDGRAGHAAAALAEVIRNTFLYPTYLTYPYHVPPDNGEGFLYDLVQMIKGLERVYPQFSERPRVSEQIEKMLDTDVFYDPDRLRTELGTSCYAVESVPFAIGVAGRNYSDFRAGILEAVNAGGDTDTNAAMVGAIIGANVGIQGIPPEWLNFRPEFMQMTDVAKRLYKAATTA